MSKKVAISTNELLPHPKYTQSLYREVISITRHFEGKAKVFSTYFSVNDFDNLSINVCWLRYPNKMKVKRRMGAIIHVIINTFVVMTLISFLIHRIEIIQYFHLWGNTQTFLSYYKTVENP